MNKIPVALMEFVDGGRAIWVHDKRGNTVLRIQVTGRIKTRRGCANNAPHADINVSGDIEICIPMKLNRRTTGIP